MAGELGAPRVDGTTAGIYLPSSGVQKAAGIVLATMAAATFGLMRAGKANAAVVDNGCEVKAGSPPTYYIHANLTEAGVVQGDTRNLVLNYTSQFDGGGYTQFKPETVTAGPGGDLYVDLTSEDPSGGVKVTDTGSTPATNIGDFSWENCTVETTSAPPSSTETPTPTPTATGTKSETPSPTDTNPSPSSSTTITFSPSGSVSISQSGSKTPSPGHSSSHGQSGGSHSNESNHPTTAGSELVTGTRGVQADTAEKQALTTRESSTLPEVMIGVGGGGLLLAAAGLAIAGRGRRH